MKIRLFVYLLTIICVAPFVSADSTALSPTPHTLPLTTVVRPTLSPQEWEELNAARAKALKANPDLIVKARALALKMRAFQEKVNAAILKEDPRIAPILDQHNHINPSPVPHDTPVPVPNR
jgi:hypothetical protein